jgi:hypothetical protein
MKKTPDYRSDANPGNAKLSADSEGLGAQNDKKTFGVGADEQEIPEFVPTKEELIHLAKYWAGRLLDVQLWTFQTGQYNRWEWTEEGYALDRIDRIKQVLPEQEVNQAIQEVEDPTKKSVGDKIWNIFRNGTQEQVEAYRKRFWREFHRREQARAAKAREKLNNPI